MAYKNITNIACADKTEAFCRIRDFIGARNATYNYSTTGIGWTLFDSSYAVDEDNPQLNDWYVMYSAGEGGDHDMYMYVKWTSASLTVIIYQSWDASTHAGSSNMSGSAASFALEEAMDTSKPIYVYGDLDGLFLNYAYSATVHRSAIYGVGKPMYAFQTGEVVVSSGALSAGSDVVVTLPAVPSHWFVGMDVCVRTTHTNNMATVKMEKARIKVISGVTVTVDLVNSYTANSKLSDSMCIYTSNNVQGFVSQRAMMIANGLINQIILTTYNTGLTITSYDPESYSDLIGLYSQLLQTTAGSVAYTENVCYTPVHNAAFTHLDLLTAPDGTSWRCFNIYNAKYIAVKEV